MLDRTDFASWQQRIILYCQGKENGVNILKSIDEGPFQMGTVREPLAEGTKGTPHLGPERPRDIYTLINHYTDAKDIWDNVKMLLEGSELTKEDREFQLHDDFENFRQHKGETIHDYYVWFAKHINDMRNIKMTMSKMQLNSKFVNNMLPEWGQFMTAVKLNRGLKDSNYDQLTSSNTRNQATVQDGRVMVQNVQGRQLRGQGTNPQGEDVDDQPVQDLALNVDNVFQADDCDAFDSDVDEALMAQTMFMANLSSADPVNDKAGPSYDSDILSEVQDHDHYQDTVCAHHEEHAMHDNVQLTYVVDSHVDYTSDSNMISYEKDNAVPVVHSNVSSVLNDTYMMIDNDMYEPHAQSVSTTSHNTVGENSLTAELATCKEQVKLYKRRARFELTEREQKINEQLRLVISNHNFKEETLKKELHSVKLQLASTINHNKLMVEQVMSLKKDFKQKENKYLEDFLDIKSLKEKVKDRLFKQDQSLQTVHMLCRPKPNYNELNKVAIGLCLTHAKQIQPALYNGHEIIKDNHVPAIVRNTEDTLEIAEITRRKMNDKMKDPECVTHKSHDLIKMKSKALKEQTTVLRPIKALMVYLPNTPATLVPRVLPTKSQVKIHIFTLIQLFLEFDKTYKKRITPTGLTKGERGFEQTKACYLKEVIPFFQTLKENFEGIQKALTKEIKDTKDVFKELKAEVAQNVVDRKHDAIEQKNLLISNDNIIDECLSKEVFSVATDSELNVARFTEMHVAHTTVKTRCLELKAKLSNLRDKSHNNNHDKLINRFSNLDVNYLKLQLKYQNLKVGLGNNPPTPDKDTPDFDSVFVIDKMKASLQGKDNVISQLKKQISHLQETSSDTGRILKVRAVDSQITQLTKKVIVLQAQNDSFRAKNDKIKQHYKELYDSIKITRAKHIEQDSVQPKVLALGKYDIDVQPIVLYLRNNRESHLNYLRHPKESVETICDIVEEAKVSVVAPFSIHDNSNVVRKVKQVWKPKQVRQVWKSTGKVLTSCSKHMTRDRSPLMNFVKKFIETVRFGNDHFGAITGYGYYVIGDSFISKVYYVEGQGHNLFSVGQFCDGDLEVAFRKNSCYVRDTDEVVATACYTKNRSLIHTRYNKIPYKMVHNKKPNLTFFRVLGALCYPTNDSEDLGKL
nr:integrase, catalytic region, zinc finger, CCHC-type, peptidase aspartic, catalytic [Tanacetum cinerariifolium]